MSDIETIRDIYLPVENAASAASANDDSIEQALDFEPGNKRENNNNPECETPDYDYLTEPSVPAWMLF